MGNLLAGETWKQVQSSDGIIVYERWVQVPGNKQARERMGEMTISSSIPFVISTLRDPAKCKQWMENVSEAYLVSRRSHNEWISYTRFSLPWPLENRDLVSVSRLNYHEAGKVLIEIQSTEHSLAPQSTAKRIRHYKAVWEIEDKGQGLVSIRFSTLSYLPPEFPRLVHDPVVRNAFLRNLIKLKVILSV